MGGTVNSGLRLSKNALQVGFGVGKTGMADPPTKSRTTYAAPALERGFDILELLATVPAGLTITEIAQRLGRSMSEVFRVTIVMERRGWLRKDAGSDRYSVSYWMLDVAYRATPAQSLATVAAPIMQSLASATNQSCHLVVRAEARGLVIQRNENLGPAGFAMRAGAVIDLVTSCSGHVLLAFADEAQRDTVLAALPTRSVAAYRALSPHLATVRERGYEMSPSARASGVTDISVPIFGFGGVIAAALTIPYLEMIDGSQLTDVDQTREMLMTAGEAISTGLGASATLTKRE